MTTLTPETAGRIFVDAAAYADPGAWHEVAGWLRREHPILRVEAECYKPFYALTRHGDILDIERQHTRYLNTLDSVLQPAAVQAARAEHGARLRTLIHMDDPDHRVYRGLASEWFKPGSIKRLEGRVAELARIYVDRMEALGAQCDFAADIALYYPLHVIMSILGVPASDEPRMLKLTQELFGSEDPELGRGRGLEDVLGVIMDFHAYFQRLTESRRADPTEDLASVLANARIEGAPVGDLELLSYYIIVATAGHDTTSSSIAGGLEALLAHPDELARLQADPSLLATAADEIIRWVSPVKHFMRTATEPDEIHGVAIEPGDWLLLSYPSANRDEAVFTEPFRFDVGRANADRHLAFGFGSHFCLGAHLARLEVRSFYRELLARVTRIHQIGPAQHIHANFVSGLKHLPVQYEFAAPS
jgi:cytochrome P450